MRHSIVRSKLSANRIVEVDAFIDQDFQNSDNSRMRYSGDLKSDSNMGEDKPLKRKGAMFYSKVSNKSGCRL